MRVLAVLVAVGLVVLFGAASARAVPIVSFKCTPDPANCNGWYRTNVSINWTVAPPDAVVGGCLSKTYTTDTKGTNELCVANDGEAEVSVQVQIKVDKTAPVVTGGSPGRGADVNGWYNRPVGIAFSGSDQTSGIAACTNTTYSGPDSGTASVAGTCTDNAGNTSAPLGYGLKYDATAPVVTGITPERGANPGGWFTRPVQFNIQGTDATSGVADCPSVAYGGPDSATATLSAACRDLAGNVSTRAVGLKYDATPPPLTELRAKAADAGVRLTWRTSPDADSVEVVRTPGVRSKAGTVIFRGVGTTFVDRRVKGGVRYAYQVRVADAAGNANADTVSAVPAKSSAGRRLLSPPPRSVVTPRHPPLLQWTPIRRAGYYNVQLFRAGRKILSVWPTRPRYQLKRRWKYAGERRALSPGKYRWLVWPGFGPRSKVDYGRRIGPSTFEVRRPRAAPR